MLGNQPGTGVTSRIPSNMPIKDRLLEEKKRLLEKINQIDKVLTLLTKNPDTEELINILGRLHY